MVLLKTRANVGPDKKVTIILPPEVKAEQVTVTIELADTAKTPDLELRDKEGQAVWQEQQAYMRLHPALVQTHLNKSVAVIGGELIDSDESQAALWERMELAFPDRPFFITKVQPEAFPTLRIRSPKIVRP